MFEYQGNQPQKLNRNQSFHSTHQYTKEGPYSRLNQSRPHEPPVNSQEIHQNDELNDEGVDYSFSHLSVKERKKLFQQNQNTNGNFQFPQRTPSVSYNRGAYAHETMSDIGDATSWRAKANTWTPKANYSDQQATHSPQISPTLIRNEARGSSVLTFEPQMSSSVHMRSRTLDSAGYRNTDQNKFNFNNDAMTRSAAYFNPRPETSQQYSRQVSGPCTRVIPSRAGSSLNHQPQSTYYHNESSGYDSYFEKSRNVSPHADRYRSQVHIPLANRGNRNSFNWPQTRQSRSQQPLRVNVYSNQERNFDNRGQIYVPINPHRSNNFISSSTSVSPNRLYNDTVYYAYPANSIHYPQTPLSRMRPIGFSDYNNYKCNAFTSKSQVHLSSSPNIRSYSPPALARTSPNSYILHDPHIVTTSHGQPQTTLIQHTIDLQNRPSFHQVPPSRNIIQAQNHHVTQFRTMNQKPQVIRPTHNNTGFYQPVKIKTKPMTQWMPSNQFNSGSSKIRERTPMPVRTSDAKFWSSANSTPQTKNIQRTPTLTSPSMNVRKTSGAFFDEEAGISEF